MCRQSLPLSPLATARFVVRFHCHPAADHAERVRREAVSVPGWSLEVCPKSVGWPGMHGEGATHGSVARAAQRQSVLRPVSSEYQLKVDLVTQGVS